MPCAFPSSAGASVYAYNNYPQINFFDFTGGLAAPVAPAGQFGCGILNVVALKCKIFAQESTCSKEFFSKQSYDELSFVKKSRNCTFKVNFLGQKSEFKKKII